MFYLIKNNNNFSKNGKVMVKKYVENMRYKF